MVVSVDRVAIVMRIAWSVLSVVIALTDAHVATWPLLQISDCELGLSELSSECDTSIWNYFGISAVAGLAVPVVLCAIPAVIPRPGTAWLATVLLWVTAAVGFSASESSVPSLLSVVGNVQAALLALLLASVHQWMAARASTPLVESAQLTT